MREDATAKALSSQLGQSFINDNKLSVAIRRIGRSDDKPVFLEKLICEDPRSCDFLGDGGYYYKKTIAFIWLSRPVIQPLVIVETTADAKMESAGSVVGVLARGVRFRVLKIVVITKRFPHYAKHKADRLVVV